MKKCSPFCVAVFLEKSVRLFLPDQIASSRKINLKWDIFDPCLHPSPTLSAAAAAASNHRLLPSDRGHHGLVGDVTVSATNGAAFS
jgi:hypothetical protein